MFNNLKLKRYGTKIRRRHCSGSRQRDQNIIQSVVAALKTITTTPA